MPPVIIGGAIAAVGAVGSAVIGSRGASAAANATTAAADRSAAVVERNYDRSAAALQPWQTSGLAANSQINALYGLGGSPGTPGTPASPATGGFGSAPGGMGGFTSSNWLAFDAWRRDHSIVGTIANDPATPGTPAIPGQTSQQAASAAFDQFRNSTGYQFRLGEGNRGVNSAYAGAGTVKSGDAMRGIAEYNQNFASNEFGNYVAGLGNQQSLGLTAAQAQAGVGGNAANSLASIYQNQGDNLANAALLRAQNTGNAVNSLATIAGGIFGRN